MAGGNSPRRSRCGLRPRTTTSTIEIQRARLVIRRMRFPRYLLERICSEGQGRHDLRCIAYTSHLSEAERDRLLPCRSPHARLRQSALEEALSTEGKACIRGMPMIGSKQVQCEDCDSPRIAACLANSIRYTSGRDGACTLVIHDNDARWGNVALRHLERRRDGAIGKQPFATA